MCPIEGCLKVSKNLGGIFEVKFTIENLVQKYYRLLKIAKRYEMLNSSADAELSPKEYLKRKYHSVLTQGLDPSPTISQTINSEISRETNIPDDTELNEDEIESQTEEKSDDDDGDGDYEPSMSVQQLLKIC